MDKTAKKRVRRKMRIYRLVAFCVKHLLNKDMDYKRRGKIERFYLVRKYTIKVVNKVVFYYSAHQKRPSRKGGGTHSPAPPEKMCQVDRLWHAFGESSSVREKRASARAHREKDVHQIWHPWK